MTFILFRNQNYWLVLKYILHINPLKHNLFQCHYWYLPFRSNIFLAIQGNQNKTMTNFIQHYQDWSLWSPWVRDSQWWETTKMTLSPSKAEPILLLKHFVHIYTNTYIHTHTHTHTKKLIIQEIVNCSHNNKIILLVIMVYLPVKVFPKSTLVK